MPHTGQPSMPEHAGLLQFVAQSAAADPPPPSPPVVPSSPGVPRDDGPHATASTNINAYDFSCIAPSSGPYKNGCLTQQSNRLAGANSAHRGAHDKPHHAG